MADFDWSALQAEAKDVLLADGEYVVMATATEATKASTGKPMIKLTLTVVEGPKRDRKVFTQFVLAAESPFALQRWFANLAAFGLDQNWFTTANPSLETIAATLLNRGAIAIVGHREWQGSDRNEVSGIKPYVPNGPTPPGMILGAPSAVAGPSVPTAAVVAGPPVPSTPPSPTTPTSAPAGPPTRPF